MTFEEFERRAIRVAGRNVEELAEKKSRLKVSFHSMEWNDKEQAYEIFFRVGLKNSTMLSPLTCSSIITDHYMAFYLVEPLNEDFKYDGDGWILYKGHKINRFWWADNENSATGKFKSLLLDYYGTTTVNLAPFDEGEEHEGIFLN